MRMRSAQMDGLRNWAEKLVRFLSQYRWLLDAYVIEFFTENHWNKLPSSWQQSLKETTPTHLARLLLSSPFHHQKNDGMDKVYPLSLLAFVACAHSLSLDREPSPHEKRGGEEEERGKSLSQAEGLDHVFRRHVKMKKQREIVSLSQEILKMVEITGCKNIIDIGSGQGHLSRYLAYHCGLKVHTIDAVGCHLLRATQFDSEVEKDMVKKEKKKFCDSAAVTGEGTGKGSITHIHSLVQPDISLDELLSRMGLKGSCGGPTVIEKEPRCGFILVGLHTCGDLGPTLLRVYSRSRRVVGVASVGCCYMKLSCCGEGQLGEVGEGGEVEVGGGGGEGGKRGEEVGGVEGRGEVQGGEKKTERPKITESTLDVRNERDSKEEMEQGMRGYPMSSWLNQQPFQLTHLSYEAREVACHSIDSYRQKLIGSSKSFHSRRNGRMKPGDMTGDCHHVKVHCHRAAVETILRQHGLKRPQVKISRSVSKSPFPEYATAVLNSLGLPLSYLERDGERLSTMTERWREVAAFFMLRLCLAPCVETLILLDRVLFLTEQGFDSRLRPIFDPAHSPRNFLISSLKASTEDNNAGQ